MMQSMQNNMECYCDQTHRDGLKRKFENEEDVIANFAKQYFKHDQKAITDVLLKFNSLLEDDFFRDILEIYMKYRDNVEIESIPKRFKCNNELCVISKNKISRRYFSDRYLLNQRKKCNTNVTLRNDKLLAIDKELQKISFLHMCRHQRSNVLNSNFHLNDELISSESSQVSQETQNLFMFHLLNEMEQRNINIPTYLLQTVTTPINMKKWIILADAFQSSTARYNVKDKADDIELHSLTFMNFTRMLVELFQNGGITSERILVLFFFCTDVLIRVVKKKLIVRFKRILGWAMEFLTQHISQFIFFEGGWETVFLDHNSNHSKVFKGFTIGVIALFIFAIAKNKFTLSKSSLFNFVTM